MFHLSFQILFIIFLSQALYFDTIKLGFCHDGLNVTCKEIEKNALLDFKSNLSDASGRLSSWIGEDCCKWKGVSCNTKTKHVITLDLRNPFRDNYSSTLSGMISSSLLDLKYLNYLDLSCNHLEENQFPNFIGSLENLRYLNLSGTEMSGSIPQSLGNLSNLQYLDLNYASFSQESSIWWVTRLSSLKHLNLGGLNLSIAASHWLQAVNTLPSLIELHLPSCGLTNLPLSLPFVNLTSLSVLDLSANHFNSTIPHWLFNLSSLTQLDLSNNRFQGMISNGFSKLSSLEILDLSYNQANEGTLSRLGKPCNLKVLKLHGNKFSGDIADFIDTLLECPNNRLERLDLGYNELTGNIPQNLGQLSSLVSLDLTRNLWEGVVTEALLINLSSLKELSIGTYSSKQTSLAFNISSDWAPPFKLRSIFIESCQLGPTFPKWLKNQTELTELTLRDSKISDTIPDWFLKLNLQLQSLDLSFNQLRGHVPNSFQFSYQASIDLNSNLFEGSLPLWSSNVSFLYLSNNLISGPIPPDIGIKMFNIYDLDISGNFLNGSIPMSLGNLKELRSLVISRNQLSGNIPKLIWDKMPNLRVVDMSNNSLTGSIPRSLGSHSILSKLMLSGNILQGNLPSSLRKCSFMWILDLSNNQLSGNIPTWIGEMGDLQVLNLRNNSFTGNIHLQLCSLSSLHILDLSKNSLSGPVPSCIGNLNGLKIDSGNSLNYYFGTNMLVVAKGIMRSYGSILYDYKGLDLSDNRLCGEIPANITSLVKLQTLNLSRNHLAGNIPSDIGSLKMLETLDLSVNHLSGHIPESMVFLDFLQALNLSYNNLSGHIPTSNHFQTLNDPSIYAGNDALCGSPLQTKCGNETSFTSENGDMVNEDDDLQKLIFFVVAGAGFFLGFWGVCGTLIINRHLRYAYFNFLQRIQDKLNCCIG